MTVLRLLGPGAAAIVLSTTMSAAGPCTGQIAQMQAQIDAKLAANAAAGPSAPEGMTALRSRQPTPHSIAEEESKLGEFSQQLLASVGAGMARAREADQAGDPKACEEALTAVRAALGQ